MPWEDVDLGKDQWEDVDLNKNQWEDVPTPKTDRFAKYKNYETPFKARHPNLYAAGGAGFEILKTIPYLKYVDKDEREDFLKLDKQHQVRSLLIEVLSAELVLGFKPVTEGAGAILASKFPRTAERIRKIAQTHIAGKSKSIKPTSKEPLPKYAGSVNLNKQAISQEAKRLEVEIFKQHGVKTSVTHGEMIAGAEKVIGKIQSDPKFAAKVIENAANGKSTLEEKLAHRMINAEKFDNLVIAAKSAEKGHIPKEAVDSMQQELKTYYLDTVQKVSSDAGRTLGMFNIQVGRNKAAKAIASLEKNLNSRQLKELRDVDWEDTVSVNNFIKRLPDPKMKDYIYEYWYNSILSGVPTHVVNAVSNTGWMAFQLPHRALTGALDKGISTVTGRARTRYMNEIFPMMAGIKTGAAKGAKAAAEMARTGKVTSYETKWAKEIGNALGAFERSPNAAVREVGKYLTVPTKALRAMDVMANSVGYDAQMGAIAKRQINLGKLSKGKVGDFIKSPPEWAHAEAMEFAKYTTFMSDPGFFSSAIMSVRDKIPGGRLIVPFVNTVGNLTKRGVEMTPGVGLTLAKGQNPAEVAAKQIEGAIITYMVWDKMDKGEVTGEAPLSEAQRERFYAQGKKPWAIKMGDKWVEYRRVEPLNTVLASASIAYDKFNNAKDDETKTEMFINAADSLKGNLLDSSYLQGVTNLTNRYGKTKGMVQRTAVSFVPYSGFLRSVSRAYEAGTEGSAKVRDTDDWTGAFSQVIPKSVMGMAGYSAKPPRLNIWGKEIELEGGIFRQWLPYRWATETKDPVEKAFEKLDIYPGLPKQTVKIRGKSVKLDDEVYRNFIIDYGNRAKEWMDIYVGKPLVQNALKDEKKHPYLKKKLNTKYNYFRDLSRKRAIKEQLLKGENNVERINQQP